MDNDTEEEYEDDLNEDYIQFEEPREEQDVQVMEENVLLEQQQEVVKKVSELLNLSPSAACLVLRHFRWNYENLSQNYFDNPTQLRKTLGINLGNTNAYRLGEGGEVRCAICMDDCPATHTFHLKCNHPFCFECWKGYLKSKLSEGPSCISTNCPFPKCTQACDEGLFEELLSEDEFAKYRLFVTRSFVEDNPHIRWCPSPGCSKAVLSKDPKRLLVRCLCGYAFCFVCGGEAHAPAKCSDLREWRLKEKGEGENSKWVFVNTKPCPACHSPIQKSDGCNHMTCSKCRNEFCWVCLDKWKKHGSSWYKCNYYDPSDTQAEERSRGRTRQELERYVFYYERYYAHFKSKSFNTEDLQKAVDKAEHIEKVSGGCNVDYIVKAVTQLIENRDMLQYTYIYAYYLDEKAPGKELFQYNQACLEKTTEELNSQLRITIAEASVDKLLHDPAYSRERLTDLTAIANDQLHKLLKGVFNEDEEYGTLALESQPPPAVPPRPTHARRDSTSSMDSKIAELTSMGFQHDQCVTVLTTCNGNVTEATELLLAMM
eukprot:NODE_886_length_1786_cov_31.486438_g830_i0.p1 GENE.NODE_886_length_1786_cov_31.486438_g830_i0~~NODE_886_length_1786_cov_31.486438_g830_i0.p1  ORF type:complete len:559 (+),score=162.41 NODE_886_length_1786_cov_31.486438_g830_i0:48-1679(+)